MKRTLIIVGKISEYLIYGFFVTVLFVILSPRLPTKNILLTYIIPTGSMTPTVLSGSVALVNPKLTNPKVGDIVVFSSPRDNTEIILHRVIEATNKGYKTKGDYNNTADAWTVPAKNIHGTLVVAIPYIGHIAAFVKKPIGFILLAVVPALMLGLSSLIDIKNGIQEEYKKHKQKKASRLAAAALLFFVLGFSLAQNQAKVVFASFMSEARIQGISILAALPSTPSPTPRPTPGHTPAPTVNCPVHVEIEGNKERLENEIHVHCESSKVVVKINHRHKERHIHYEFEYDSDEGKQGIIGDFEDDGEDDIQKDFYMGNCSTSSCTSNHRTRNQHLKLKFD